MRERAFEDEGAALEPVVRPVALRDAVQEDLERWHHMRR